MLCRSWVRPQQPDQRNATDAKALGDFPIAAPLVRPPFHLRRELASSREPPMRFSNLVGSVHSRSHASPLYVPLELREHRQHTGQPTPAGGRQVEGLRLGDQPEQTRGRPRPGLGARQRPSAGDTLSPYSAPSPRSTPSPTSTPRPTTSPRQASTPTPAPPVPAPRRSEDCSAAPAPAGASVRPASSSTTPCAPTTPPAANAP